MIFKKSILKLKTIWKKNLLSKVFIILNILTGSFFLFSMMLKLLSLRSWVSFNIEILGSNLGYINAFLILLIESFIAISFIRVSSYKSLYLLALLFVSILTIIVISFKSLFQSCMCFGTFIQIKPDITFLIKNIVILIDIVCIYLINFKLNKKSYYEKHEN